MGDRKHLTGIEVERLIEAIKGSRNEKRDRCLVLLMYRHGLRVSEACGLLLEQVDTESRVLHVQRLADQGADTRLIQDYLGHRNIQHTVRYTASNPARFEKLWR
jgi:site-specific recombinase XerD